MLFFFFSYVLETVIERQRQRQRQSLPSPGSPPDGCNGRSHADPKPGARSFFQVTHMGAGARGGLGPSSAAFPHHSRELDRPQYSAIFIFKKNVKRFIYLGRALQCSGLMPWPEAPASHRSAIRWKTSLCLSSLCVTLTFK